MAHICIYDFLHKVKLRYIIRQPTTINTYTPFNTFSRSFATLVV